MLKEGQRFSKRCRTSVLILILMEHAQRENVILEILQKLFNMS